MQQTLFSGPGNPEQNSLRVESSRPAFKQDLNEAQYEAVTYLDGPLLVIAGAGSGKTRTLVYRMAYLVEQGVNPANILLPSSGGTGIRLNTASTIFHFIPSLSIRIRGTSTIEKKPEREMICREGDTRNWNKIPQINAIAILIPGPAAPTHIISLLGFLRFAKFTGTGFAAPIMNPANR